MRLAATDSQQRTSEVFSYYLIAYLLCNALRNPCKIIYAAISEGQERRLRNRVTCPTPSCATVPFRAVEVHPCACHFFRFCTNVRRLFSLFLEARWHTFRPAGSAGLVHLLIEGDWDLKELSCFRRGCSASFRDVVTYERVQRSTVS